MSMKRSLQAELFAIETTYSCSRASLFLDIILPTGADPLVNDQDLCVFFTQPNQNLLYQIRLHPARVKHPTRVPNCCFRR